MNLSFGNMTLELNMFNMCKRPHHQEDYDNENEEIDIIEPIIEEHIGDENFTDFIEICFAGSVESSKELNCDTANICSILDSVQVPISDDDQSNFEDMTQYEEPNEDEAPELELKPLLEELKYVYLREQQTYPVVISSQLTHDQEAPMMQPPDWSLPFELMCDASNYAVSAVLGQRKKGGDRGLSKLVSETAFVRRRGIIPKALKPLACLPNPLAGEELVVSEYFFLHELNNDKDNWMIRVRFCRMWESINTKKNRELISVDMTFIDENVENLMHATIRKHLVTRFKHMLSEGSLYSVKNLKVVSTTGEYRPLSNQYKIIFLVITSLKRLEEGIVKISINGFQFVFPNLIDLRVNDNTILSDVVGSLCGVGDIEIVRAG
ncbi:hypothetical protein WN944_018582 [Citrus x changshan-huyou]|uniref:Replication protein A 70 kDa DNA-binding subunit B/D first OB fold domain-containing protein n=1 Tax=Citrus x changshan-huyou TaxID=2935761 RepID=A0AAP0QEB7_9ROSI